MKVKVCGIKNKSNMQALKLLKIDMIGHIFYEPSSRHVADEQVLEESFVEGDKVGVFVNASISYIKSKVKTARLSMVQLHGDESADFCESLKNEIDVQIIKAFSIKNAEDFADTQKYCTVVDYFLFDTKGELPGGNGIQFDWSLLRYYEGSKPFLLSGGIGPNHVEDIKKINHPLLFAIDVNSKFEIEPGLKDMASLKQFIHDLSH